MPLDTRVTITVGGDYETLPVDKYTCQVLDVNLDTQRNFTTQEEEPVLNYKFVVLNTDKTTDSGASARGRFLFRRCRPVLNPKSWLGKLANACSPRDLTEEEQKAFDPESLLGKQVDVLVEHNEGKGSHAGKIFANIAVFSRTRTPLAPISEDELTTKDESKSVVGSDNAAAFAKILAEDTKNATTVQDAGVSSGEEPGDVSRLEAALARAKAKAAAVKK